VAGKIENNFVALVDASLEILDGVPQRIAAQVVDCVTSKPAFLSVAAISAASLRALPKRGTFL
jgi:hypothetical protein